MSAEEGKITERYGIGFLSIGLAIANFLRS